MSEYPILHPTALANPLFTYYHPFCSWIFAGRRAEEARMERARIAEDRVFDRGLADEVRLAFEEVA